MEKQKTLRLLVTDKSCYDIFDNAQEAKIFDGYFYEYDNIIITGGEPFLFPQKLIALIKKIKYDNYSAKIYIDCSILSNDFQDFINIMYLINGLYFTIHDEKSFSDFEKINNELDNFHTGQYLFLTIFNDIKLSPINLRCWFVKIQDRNFIDNEIYYRLPELW